MRNQPRHHRQNLFLASAAAGLALLACFGLGGAATCHPDDEAGLLGFKKGITADPSGMLATWQAGTDCCGWEGVVCFDDRRVIQIGLYGNPDRPNFFLSGEISRSISRLTHLIGFYLGSHPNITGRFPTALFRLPALRSVGISGTGLSGRLPSNFGAFAGPLETIGLSGNRFVGPIPRSISRLGNLTELDLASNRFTGRIPIALKSLTSLTRFILAGNRLTGPVPGFLGTFSQLTHLVLSRNELTGNIPASISALAPTLKFLELGGNYLTGTIPEFIGNFESLDTLDLSGNKLNGTVPKSFSNLRKIFNLDLSRNELVDPFPAMNVEEIASLDLSYNRFHLNEIPAWATSSPVIFSLKLARCGIKMRLDDWRPYQTYFYDILDLSENEITGSPVWFVSNAEFLLSFKAKGNNLTFDFGGMKFPKRMTDLDLSHNSMHGRVPAGVAALTTLNVSSNHLCGPLPATKFPASAFLDNDCLCGAPLPPC